MMEDTIRFKTSASIELTNVELRNVSPIIQAELLDIDEHINVPVASREYLTITFSLYDSCTICEKPFRKRIRATVAVTQTRGRKGM